MRIAEVVNARLMGNVLLLAEHVLLTKVDITMESVPGLKCSLQRLEQLSKGHHY